MRATTTFQIKSWDEKPYAEFGDGRKLNRALVSYTYTGDLEGEGSLEYLMAYGADGTGRYVGMERIIGTLHGKAGSFVAQHTGTFEAHGVKADWLIVEGCGTGALEKIRGSGAFAIAGQGPYTISFDYEV